MIHCKQIKKNPVNLTKDEDKNNNKIKEKYVHTWVPVFIFNIKVNKKTFNKIKIKLMKMIQENQWK